MLIISHVADPDGCTPIVLAKLTFKDFDYILSDIDETDNYVKDNLDKQDIIYVVDLNISEELADYILKNYPNKVKVFDHHLSKIYMNKYPFIKVVDEDKIKECGTTLFYKYLIENFDNKYLHKKTTLEMIEHVRTMDTYDFRITKKETAEKINILFKIYGKIGYINKFYNVLKSNKPLYSKEDKNLIKLEKDRIKRYIMEKEFQVININNNKVGVVFAERNISELGNYILENNDLDYVTLINVSHGISFRGKDKVDLSLLATKHNGGGHFNASGCPLPDNLQELIIKEIFKDEYKNN